MHPIHNSSKENPAQDDPSNYDRRSETSPCLLGGWNQSGLSSANWKVVNLQVSCLYAQSNMATFYIRSDPGKQLDEVQS